ncbi:MAG: HAD hydrolase family protein [Nitrososphaerota archaeon]|nr:HAD hydrolase family protein [Nitrososphaerota archaeon]
MSVKRTDRFTSLVETKEELSRPAFERWLEQPDFSEGLKAAFYYLDHRLITEIYDRHIDETLQMVHEFIRGFDTTLSKRIPDDQVPLAFGILASLLVEVGQYRQEVVANDPKFVALRQETSFALSHLLATRIFDSISQDVNDEVVPLLSECANRYYPYRVILAGVAAERLFDMTSRTHDTRTKRVLEGIYGLKYPRFGTSGIRGIWGRDITRKRVEFVVQAICEYMDRTESRNRNIILGYDSRLHADELARWVAGTFLANHFTVSLTRRDTPTPVVNFWATEHLKQEVAGIVVCTASHNPPEWHGVKFSLRSGVPAPTSVTDWIGARTNLHMIMNSPSSSADLAAASNFGTLSVFDPAKEYQNWVLSKAEGVGVNLTAIKEWFQDKTIAIDEMHGAGRGYLGGIIDSLGLNFIVSHGTRDPTFGDLAYANPEEPFVSQLQHLVRKTRAAVGLAMDADADRFGAIDDDGTFFSASQVIMMMIDHLLRDRMMKGKIIHSFTTTPAIAEVIEKSGFGTNVEKPNQALVPPYALHPFYGVSLGQREMLAGLPTFVTMVGVKYQAEAMTMDRQYKVTSNPNFRQSFILSAEESGGMTSKGHISDKDGLWADLLVLDLMAFNRKQLREIWSDLTRRLGWVPHFGRIDVDGTDEMKSALVNYYYDNPTRAIGGLAPKYVGGIRHDFTEIQFGTPQKIIARLIIRASGTEPICRIYTEASSEETRRALELDVLSKFDEVASSEVSKAKTLWQLIDYLKVTPPLRGVVSTVRERIRFLSMDGGDVSTKLRDELLNLVEKLDTRKRELVELWIPKIEEWSTQPLHVLPDFAELRRGIMAFDFDGTLVHKGDTAFSGAPEFAALLKLGCNLAILTTGPIDAIHGKLVLPLKRELQSSRQIGLMTGLTIYSDGAGRKFNLDKQGRLMENLGFRRQALIPLTDIRLMKSVADRAVREALPLLSDRKGLEITTRKNVQLVIAPVEGRNRDKLISTMSKLIARARTKESYQIRRSGKSQVEVIRAGTDKKRALVDLMSTLHVPESKVIYFGDEFHEGGNDMVIADLKVTKVALSVQASPTGIPGILYVGPTDITNLLKEWRKNVI